MAMTAGELRERLDDWGDHVPVVIVVNDGEDEHIVNDFDVDDTHAGDGELKVALTFDL